MDFLSLKFYAKSIDKDLQFLKSKGFDFKSETEFDTFNKFTKYLLALKMKPREFYASTNDFCFGFEIKQLGKEFDLLRLGTNYNINIELKSSSTYEKQIKQLQKNYFYLKYLDTPTYYFSYNAETDDVIMGYVKENENSLTFISEQQGDSLINILKEQVYTFLNYEQMLEMFDVSNYLVSPFNDTEKFLEGKYLLSPQQENLKKEIIKSDKFFFIINARPGTGKSLLMLDIANTLYQNHDTDKILIIHTGILNDGHNKLLDKGFNILPIKNYFDGLTPNPEYIFIDETQRINIYQLENIVSKVNELNAKLIIFMDSDQTLISGENPEEVLKLIENKSKQDIHEFKLSTKFRNNSQMASFITKLTRIPFTITPEFLVSNSNKNIDIKYFPNVDFASFHFRHLRSKGFTILGYTTSRKNSDPFDNTPRGDFNSHKAIGQEFDNVAIIIDKNFQYREESTHYRLIGTNESYYSSDNMFYQNITRVRKKLTLIIIDNPDVFRKITSILDTL
ncbi:DNA/RNA helicase domain-containing protein [Ruoffia sp. FAM 24228]|uniref:DNA/RNA helicase domain-containing protein n=1 Tax=unclassified Ruoffia TaxID=2862149 RepID=UPI003886682E